MKELWNNIWFPIILVVLVLVSVGAIERLNDKVNGIREAVGYTAYQTERLADEKLLNNGECKLDDFEVVEVTRTPWRGVENWGEYRAVVQRYWVDVKFCGEVARRYNVPEVLQHLYHPAVHNEYD